MNEWIELWNLCEVVTIHSFGDRVAHTHIDDDQTNK